ncbi:MAG: ATP-binding protein [Lachnospiraceae bacterium]|nr:ATP-binding protein [Lachnospiraceae bacterium]
MRENQLIVYRNLEEGGLFFGMARLMRVYGEEALPLEERVSLLYRCAGELLETTGQHGFYGNLWHCYLANLLVNNENIYSRACEMRGEAGGSINGAVLHDMAIFKEFFDYDFGPMMECLKASELIALFCYESCEEGSRVYNTRIRGRVCELAVKLGQAADPIEMKAALSDFYREYGVGKLGLHKAFRIVREDGGMEILPILNIAHVRLDDLVGYELPKQKLIQNTEAFVSGGKANNCLLFGDAGTGKSSCIKAIANAYYDRGLRLIEVYKHQFRELHEVIGRIKNRNYKFIIYMDDLSFEEFETEYKYLKAVIEGGLEKKPDNVLIYATSNRRHLIKETFADKEGRRDQLHAGDTVQEKLSLASRFGVTIFFGAPDQKQFQEIVRTLAERNGILMPKEELLLEANRWELSHGGLSGRTAQQFVDYLSGKERDSKL